MQILQMVPRLNSDEIAAAALTLPDWQIGETLQRTFRFKNFAESMAFVNRVAARAEAANHHPDIRIQWNRVSLELTSHDAGGLTGRDFALAQEIQGL